MRKILFLIWALSGATLVMAQAPVDFAPRLFFKEIKKSLDMNDPQVVEMMPGQSSSCGQFFSISEEKNKDHKGFAYIGRVNSCRGGGCSISDEASCSSVFEYFDFFILFDKSGEVAAVRVYNYQATHGQEVTARSWLKQFNGFRGEVELRAGKNIDAISGATISVNSITSEIQDKTKQLQILLK